MSLVEKFKEATKKDIDFILETYFLLRRFIEHQIKEHPHLEGKIPRLPLIHDVEMMLRHLIDLYKTLVRIELEEDRDYYVAWSVIETLKFVEDLEEL